MDETNNDAVPVLFRADRTQRGGAGDRIEITAVFPTLPGTDDPDTMTCYAHIGQHSTCSVGWYREKTRPAKPEEYESLARELQSLGYRLDVRERLTSDLHAARRYAAVAAIPVRAIEVWDERFATPRRLARHDNVPRDWLLRDVLERLGIGDHLAVYEVGADSRECLQQGRKRP